MQVDYLIIIFVLWLNFEELSTSIEGCTKYNNDKAIYVPLRLKISSTSIDVH